MRYETNGKQSLTLLTRTSLNLIVLSSFLCLSEKRLSCSALVPYKPAKQGINRLDVTKADPLSRRQSLCAFGQHSPGKSRRQSCRCVNRCPTGGQSTNGLLFVERLSQRQQNAVKETNGDKHSTEWP